MKYPLFIFAALFLLESGKIRNLVLFSLENAHNTHSETSDFLKQ